MRWPRFRFGILTMTILVMISAVVLTAWNLVPRALDPFLGDRSGTIPERWVSGGAARYFAVRAVLAGMVASPFSFAIALALRPPPGGRTGRRAAMRWLGVAAGLAACGLAILNCPLDGMRIAWLLRDGSGVSFYHQYRFWPGAHVTPCLELTTPAGRSRSYPIARNTRYQGLPLLRTNAEQKTIWLIDDPDARARRGGVWCSIDRTTGDFVAAGGPYQAGVGETSGFPPSR
ncbi:hypothetical protein [Paludisphaera mucosa]|uniref:Uncharacterized protein n=1 Tax=Paludisphaera mucosa TaxID=3030827 RepID=A0ABT6FBH7_9BACT|nr:hypothetical protein [Paludisphaera mucosa]MDG3004896.1 hypothetical protein [Paludisphaera mucosa]